MPKRPSERYVPGDIPDTLPGLIQFLYDELPRIAQALNEFPVGVNVQQSVPGVPINLIPTTFNLFIGEPFDFDLPGGGWNSATGEWTAPVSGLYQLNLVADVTPFGTGNKDYAANLEFLVNDLVVFSAGNVGQDDFRLGTAIAISSFLTRGDVLRATITLVHDSFVGSTTVTAFMGISSTAQQ